MRIRTFTLLLSLFSLPGLTQVYKTVDENGVTEFSDTPSTQNAARINIQPANVIETTTAAPDPADPAEQSPFKYESITITAPTNEQTLFDNAQNINVAVNVEPGLNTEQGDSIVIQVDGETVSEGNSQLVNLGDMDRGTHTVTAAIINRNGRELVGSEPVTFFVRQPSINLPGRQTPGNNNNGSGNFQNRGAASVGTATGSFQGRGAASAGTGPGGAQARGAASGGTR